MRGCRYFQRNFVRTAHVSAFQRFLSMTGASPQSKFVKDYISEIAAITTPKDIHVCDGSESEANSLVEVSFVPCHCFVFGFVWHVML